MSNYLLDTNSVIYFFDGEEKISKFIENRKNLISISFITKIELLCFKTEDKNIINEINEFINEVEVLSIDDEIINKTIEYRRELNLKIPDAIIAATAKVRKFILVTADKSLIKKLEGMEIVTPI